MIILLILIIVVEAYIKNVSMMTEYVKKLPNCGLVSINKKCKMSFTKLKTDIRYIHLFFLIKELCYEGYLVKNVYFLFSSWDEASLLKKCYLTGTTWDYHIRNHRYTIPEVDIPYLNFIIASKNPECHDDILVLYDPFQNYFGEDQLLGENIMNLYIVIIDIEQSNI